MRNFFSILILTLSFNVSLNFALLVSAESELLNKQPFHSSKSCGLTSFLYAKVNRNMLNILFAIGANLSSEVSTKVSEMFSDLLVGLIQINPCQEDSNAFSAFLNRTNPQPIRTFDDAKFQINLFNNFYLTAIGLPRFKIADISRNFLPSFYLEFADYVFEYFNLVAMKSISTVESQKKIINMLQLTSSLLPGNVFSSFLRNYVFDYPYVPTRRRSDLRLYLCQMQNDFNSLIFRATFDCANLESFYGPKTVSW